MERRIDLAGRLDGKTVQGDGSVRYTARLTRTGVFQYADHAELRTADEVFAPKSLESFKGLTVTDGHQAFVNSKNWKAVSVGHVGDDVHQDGDFVVASVVINDASMIAKIDDGQRAEISMGYTVNLDATPGVTANGEKYDAVQRDIVGNHAALGPVGWGRAGANVRLLDGAAYADVMSTSVTRVDAPAIDVTQVNADLAAARAESEALRKERDAARSDAAAATKRADTIEADRDAQKSRADKAEADIETVRKDAESRIDARVALIDSARGVLGNEASFAGKTDREVRAAVIAKIDPAVNLDGKSDDYVTARFDMAVDSARTDRAELADVNTATTHPAPTGEKSRLDTALENQAATRELQSKSGPPAGALTRK